MTAYPVSGKKTRISETTPDRVNFWPGSFRKSKCQDLAQAVERAKGPTSRLATNRSDGSKLPPRPVRLLPNPGARSAFVLFLPQHRRTCCARRMNSQHRTLRFGAVAEFKVFVKLANDAGGRFHRVRGQRITLMNWQP